MNQYKYFRTHNFPKLRGCIIQLPHILGCLLLLQMFLNKSPNVLIMNIYMFQTKTMIYATMTILMMTHNTLILQENTITVTGHFLLKTQNQLQEIRKNCKEACICQLKKSLHQVNNICAFK